MTVEEAAVQAGQIVGLLRNDQGQDVFNLRPAIACFDEAGELLEVNENPLGAADPSLEVGDETTVAFTPEQGAGDLEGLCPAVLFVGQAQEALPWRRSRRAAVSRHRRPPRPAAGASRRGGLSDQPRPNRRSVIALAAVAGERQTGL